MARKRMIDPEFWSDEKIGRLDYPVQLLFIGMWNFADDEGLIKYAPPFLRSRVFPYKDIPLETIQEWQKVLEESHLVHPYGRTEQRYAWIINFLNHQVINRPQPSKLPAPTINSGLFKVALILRDKGVCHLCHNQVVKTDSSTWCNSRLPSIDHVIPLSKGGSNYPSNLKIACLTCNKTRGNKDLRKITNQSMNNHGTFNGKLREVNIREVNISKENIFVFWDYFLLKTKKAFKLTNDNRDLIKRRLIEGYTLEQLKKAVDAFMTDDWPGRSSNLDLIYCIGKQKGKPDSLEKWLNKEPPCKKCKNTGRYDNQRGFNVICDCPAGKRLEKKT